VDSSISAIYARAAGEARNWSPPAPPCACAYKRSHRQSGELPLLPSCRACKWDTVPIPDWRRLFGMGIKLGGATSTSALHRAWSAPARIRPPLWAIRGRPHLTPAANPRSQSPQTPTPPTRSSNCLPLPRPRRRATVNLNSRELGHARIPPWHVTVQGLSVRGPESEGRTGDRPGVRGSLSSWECRDGRSSAMECPAADFTATMGGSDGRVTGTLSLFPGYVGGRAWCERRGAGTSGGVGNASSLSSGSGGGCSGEDCHCRQARMEGAFHRKADREHGGESNPHIPARQRPAPDPE
jgi:hypothetical protein